MSQVLAKTVSSAALSFTEAVLPLLVETYTDTVANYTAAAQNNTTVGAYIVAALAPSLLAGNASPSIKKSLAKVSLRDQCLVFEPKPSFLLSPRVFGKLTTEEELKKRGEETEKDRQERTEK